MAELERLQKVLARMGVASRRHAETLITAGLVEVDGQVASLGMKVSGDEEIVVSSERVSKPQKIVTLMLYKPRGVITTVKDTHQRPTVMTLVPQVPGLHPVGRLDADSEGLLLLTNDGDLTLRLTHPRYGHTKTYRVWCAEGEVAAQDIFCLKKGVELADGLARAKDIRPLEGGLTLALTEGRNHQVRRMLKQIGYTVTRLKRTHVNHLSLGALRPGEHRQLTEKDLKHLQ